MQMSRVRRDAPGNVILTTPNPGKGPPAICHASRSVHDTPGHYGLRMAIVRANITLTEFGDLFLLVRPDYAAVMLTRGDMCTVNSLCCVAVCTLV